MRSRSVRKAGSVGARGARCVVAKARAVEMEGLDAVGVGVSVAVRISSISWRRRREKWREASVSRSWEAKLVEALESRGSEEMVRGLRVVILRTEGVFALIMAD